MSVRGFASDNHAGAHPEVLEALVAANDGHAGSYGADAWTARAEELFREHFGPEARGFCVFNGSGANVAAIDALTGPHEAVICTDVAHMHVDECGAPERLAGTKLLTVSTEHGKLGPDDLRRWEPNRGDEHRVQPRLVSITQATELGTVYTLDETRAIADSRARARHAAARRRRPARQRRGGARRVARRADHRGRCRRGLLRRDEERPGGRRRGRLLPPRARRRLQLHPQADAPARLEDALHLRPVRGAARAASCGCENARHANAMAARLAAAAAAVDGVEISHPVEANAVFARLPRAAIDRLLAELPGEHPFYVWDEAADEVRWMCAWDTAPEDVDGFAAAVATAVEGATG